MVCGREHSLGAVYCASASFCIALDGEDNALTYNGSSWSAPVRIGAVGVGVVSCPSASFCVALDRNGDAFTFNGSSWSAPVNIGAAEGGVLSCPSESFCAEVGLNGDARTYNGSSWSAPVNISRGVTIGSVSCPSMSFCVATGSGHNKPPYDNIALTYSSSQAGASVKLEGVKVTARNVVVTIETTQAGTVTITGPGLKKTVKTLAAGTHHVTLALTKVGTAERKKGKKIKLSVSLKTSSKTVSASKVIKL
jgi:hypothetical protein